VLSALTALLVIGEVTTHVIGTKYKQLYIKSNAYSLAAAAAFLIGFLLLSAVRPTGPAASLTTLPPVIILVRNLLLILKLATGVRRLSDFAMNVTMHPAQTILLSFLSVIVVGAALLMLPIATPDQQGLPLMDALFTATSAVCVTGLIVVDTAVAFTLFGKLVILGLIQAGGLGIMIVSFFAVFMIRRSISVEQKLLISYMLSEQDMTSLYATLRSIVYTTFFIELAGAILLFFGFARHFGTSGETFLFAVFHSVSAFCNAGFALFSDSLVRFRSDALVTLVVAGLIIAGGVSFAVITNVRTTLRRSVRRLVSRRATGVAKLTLNSKVVLAATAVLILVGALLIYALEHERTLSADPLPVQYLSALFQSVTTRTAGFNTVAFGDLRTPTYLVMMVFMFIGAAAGSTAGGIKVNSLAVILAYLASTIRGRRSVVLNHYSVSPGVVLRALMVALFGLSAVLLGTILLSLTEDAGLQELLFEAVSAFGTVGLSTGVTPLLTAGGKIVIMALMFMGRLGPLTLIAAASRRESGVQVQYPSGRILIG
jgi:trk system potassium uptake protein TrkH